MSSQERNNPAPCPATALFAAIDIGSHTTRMLIVRKEGMELVPLRTERRVTRLAEGFNDPGEIGSEPQERNLAALREYVSILKDFGVEKIACGATGVVRRAQNSASVTARMAEETGTAASVLSEEKEALLSTRGALSVLPQMEEDVLTFDIGGGSTEFLLAPFRGEAPAWWSSRPIGAAILTSAFLSEDPPGPGAVERAARAARNEILSAKEQLYATLGDSVIIRDSNPFRLAGTAGTVTTLAAMQLRMETYIPFRVNGLRLARGWIADTVDSLAKMPLAAKRGIPGLEPGREDIILGGAIVVREILDGFGCDGFTVTDAGLLEGLLLDLVERECSLCLPGFGLRTRLTWRLQKR